MKRVQCEKCPWRSSTNPRDIPDGYSVDKHRALRNTVRSGLDSIQGPLRMMACHETGSPEAPPLPCVGWLANQLGPGNNLGLRMAVASGRVDGDFDLEVPQHETLEETLP